MVKEQNKDNSKNANSKGFSKESSRATKINVSTVYETRTGQLSPFGSLLGLIKSFDLLILQRSLYWVRTMKSVGKRLR